MSRGPDYFQALNVPESFKLTKAQCKPGTLWTYEPRNPLPPFWLLGDPYLRYADVESRDQAKLMALGVAVYRPGNNVLEAFFYFGKPVVWLSDFVIKDYLVPG